MKRSTSLPAIYLLLAVLLAAGPRAGLGQRNTFGTPRTAGAQKFALLVGINDYVYDMKKAALANRNDGLRPLSGAENDALDMRQLLIEQYGFPDDDRHIKVLLSMKKGRVGNVNVQEATRQNILDNLDDFIVANAEKNPGSVVVIYYSGHGSRTDDLSGDETQDRKDETVVPADSRQGGVRDITDDELDARIKRLTEGKAKANLTLIFDSCHSGTAARSDALPKEAPEEPAPAAPGTNPGKEAAATQAQRDAPLSLDGYAAPSKSYTVISGSMSWQQSYEMPSERLADSAHPNGALTYYLMRALKQEPSATYREVMEKVASEVQQVYSYQSPQLEGNIDRPFFEVAGVRRKTPIKILKSAGDEITIAAGKALGIRKGSFIAVYSAGSTMIGDKEILAHGKIDDVAGDTSTATLALVAPDLKQVPLDAKVTLVSPALGSEPMRVAFDTSPGIASKAAGEVQAKLTHLLRGIDLIQIKPTESPLKSAGAGEWDTAVLRGTGRQFLEGMQRSPESKDIDDWRAPKDDEEVFYLAKKDGWPLYNFWVHAADYDRAAAELSTTLQLHAKQESLRALTNDVSSFKDKLSLNLYKVVGERAVNGRREPVYESVPASALGTPSFGLGQDFAVEIQNDTDEDLFVYLYALGTTGSIALMELPISIDDKLRRRSTIKTVPYTAGLPLGRESFFLIASTKKIDTPQVWEQVGVTTRGPEDRGDESPLDQLMREAAMRTRDTKPSSKYKLNDWATASVSFFNFVPPPPRGQ